MRISLENLYVDFFKVQSAFSDYVGLVLNYLIIHGLCQFTQFKIQSYDKIFKIRFCFPKRRENPGYAYTCLQVFGHYPYQTICILKLILKYLKCIFSI